MIVLEIDIDESKYNSIGSSKCFEDLKMYINLGLASSRKASENIMQVSMKDLQMYLTIGEIGILKFEEEFKIDNNISDFFSNLRNNMEDHKKLIKRIYDYFCNIAISNLSVDKFQELLELQYKKGVDEGKFEIKCAFRRLMTL